MQETAVNRTKNLLKEMRVEESSRREQLGARTSYLIGVCKNRGTCTRVWQMHETRTPTLRACPVRNVRSNKKEKEGRAVQVPAVPAHSTLLQDLTQVFVECYLGRVDP